MKSLLVALLSVMVVGCGADSGSSPGSDPTPGATAQTDAAASPSRLEIRIVAGVAGPESAAPPGATPSADGGLVGADLPSTQGQDLEQSITWAGNPPNAWTARFGSFGCPSPDALKRSHDPEEPLLTCDGDGNRYLLSRAVIDGSSLRSATAENPANELTWAVSLQLNPAASHEFETISRELLDNKNVGVEPSQVALVLDGSVLSAPQFTSVIPDGRMQISGNFTEHSAKTLAAELSPG